MDRVSKAKVLLKTLNSFIQEYENAHEAYTGHHAAQFCKLLSNIPSEIDEDSFLKTQMPVIMPNYVPKSAVFLTMNYLEEYISAQKPTYLQDFIENAEELRDEGLMIPSAVCIRLYAEQILHIKTKEKLSLEGKPMLGNIWWNMKKKGLISQEDYSTHLPFIEKLNHIIHKSDEYSEIDPTSAEISELIRWVMRFE